VKFHHFIKMRKEVIETVIARIRMVFVFNGLFLKFSVQ